MSRRNLVQGKYQIQRPAKYKGNPHSIVFRSSWELKMCQWCDRNDRVLKWSSEEVVVPYTNPVTGTNHRYFIDFWVKYKTKTGDIQQYLIEVKPRAQTLPPKAKRRTKRHLKEVQTYVINEAKWKAATSFAEERKMTFCIFTEKELGIN